MIAVLMHHHSFSLQDAVDFVGELCKQSIDRFIRDRAALKNCSWGTKIDRDVDVYAEGLASWIVGSLHWYVCVHRTFFLPIFIRWSCRSFETERYFGKSGMEVKKTRVVDLLPLAKTRRV
jgi:hypothetical protein